MQVRKICCKCKLVKPASELVLSNRSADGYSGKCKPCENMDRKTVHAEARRKVVYYYSDSMGCKCCGDKHLEFLAIDHINGGGRKHRQEIGRGDSLALYRWLIKNHFPAGFQILCHNCNHAKHFFGECPHQKEKL